MTELNKYLDSKLVSKLWPIAMVDTRRKIFLLRKMTTDVFIFEKQLLLIKKCKINVTYLKWILFRKFFNISFLISWTIMWRYDKKIIVRASVRDNINAILLRNYRSRNDDLKNYRIVSSSCIPNKFKQILFLTSQRKVCEKIGSRICIFNCCFSTNTLELLLLNCI